LQDDWFKRAVSSIPPSLRPSAMPPPRTAGEPLWSAASGAIGGGLGAIALVVAAMGSRIPFPLQRTPLLILGGVLVGALIGRISRRLVRVLPRVVFGSLFAGAVWLFFYAFFVTRFAPQMASAVPFAKSAVGALIYGACTGAVPPIRVRSERGRSV
jgi:hypothetical protein